VVRKSGTVPELLAGEDKTLLFRRDLAVLNLRLCIVDGVGWLDLKSNRLSQPAVAETNDGAHMVGQKRVREETEPLSFTVQAIENVEMNVGFRTTTSYIA
jgi:hypothetical protein